MTESKHQDTEANRVQVEIAGRTYTLRGHRDVKSVRRLAAMVDERMSSIAAHTATPDTTRVAILAALNIADELHKARSQASPPATTPACKHESRDEDLCRILDAALAG